MISVHPPSYDVLDQFDIDEALAIIRPFVVKVEPVVAPFCESGVRQGGFILGGGRCVNLWTGEPVEPLKLTAYKLLYMYPSGRVYKGNDANIETRHGDGSMHLRVPFTTAENTHDAGVVQMMRIAAVHYLSFGALSCNPENARRYQATGEWVEHYDED